MSKKIILTSFSTWLSHHSSNASDNLLEEIQQHQFESSSLTFLRQLPVDVPQASGRAIAAIEKIQPDLVICCGMAESRSLLTVESNATCGVDRLKTSVELDKLVSQLSITSLSHDAGKFVCEGLYYQVLNHLQKFQPQSQSIFVHVPVLTTGNSEQIITDFTSIIKKLTS